jgi:hypothetical protein
MTPGDRFGPYEVVAPLGALRPFGKLRAAPSPVRGVG